MCNLQDALSGHDFSHAGNRKFTTALAAEVLFYEFSHRIEIAPLRNRPSSRSDA
jgi:hypothetical protein